MTEIHPFSATPGSHKSSPVASAVLGSYRHTPPRLTPTIFKGQVGDKVVPNVCVCGLMVARREGQTTTKIMNLLLEKPVAPVKASWVGAGGDKMENMSLNILQPGFGLRAPAASASGLSTQESPPRVFN